MLERFFCARASFASSWIFAAAFCSCSRASSGALRGKDSTGSRSRARDLVFPPQILLLANSCFSSALPWLLHCLSSVWALSFRPVTVPCQKISSARSRGAVPRPERVARNFCPALFLLGLCSRPGLQPMKQFARPLVFLQSRSRAQFPFTASDFDSHV
jgi:hypothetical protein